MKDYSTSHPNSFAVRTGFFSDMAFNILEGLMYTLRYGDKYKRSEAWARIWGFVKIDRDDNGETVLLVDKTSGGYPRRGHQTNPYVKSRRDEKTYNLVTEPYSFEAIMSVILPKLHTVVNRFLKMREMTTGERHRWSFNNFEPITDIEGAKEVPTVNEAVAFFDYFKFNKKFMRRKDGLPEKLIGTPRSKSDAKALETVRNKIAKIKADHQALAHQIENERDRMLEMIRREYNNRLNEIADKMKDDLNALNGAE